jgi:hypothetical protein
VWLARAFVVALVRLARLFGVGLCPNYVLSHGALAQDRRDLYSAHDLAQMVPLVGRAVYAEFRAANAWAHDYLPHARRPLRDQPECAPRGLLRLLQHWGERLLSGRLGDALEGWERRRKLPRFARAAGPEAQFDVDRVKGHVHDHGRRVLREFETRLARHLTAHDLD